MNCVIIDDNWKTASALQQLLETVPGVQQIHKAVKPYLINSLMACEQIDIVFIRVRLWEYRQFEKLKQMPVVVFLSGGRDKLTLKTETAVTYTLREPYLPFELGQLINKIEAARITSDPSFFFLRYDGRFHKTHFKDIELIELKQGSYVQFHLSYGSWLIPGSISGWLPRLPEEQFIRISDTLVIPRSELHKITGDEYVFRGRPIKLTFRFAAAARREMENWPHQS